MNVLNYLKDLKGEKIYMRQDELIQVDIDALTAPGLTTEERAVLGLLKKGRENAITEKAISDITGLSGVEVRAIIRHLILEHGYLIASAVSTPAGFFVAETEDEVREATRSLRHRGISILIRAAKLQKLSLEEIFHQARMEFEREILK